jgi:hypothetical protein
MLEDPRTIVRHLAQAEEHVAQGAMHIARQREIVDQLARDGHDNRLAAELLSTFESTQANHLADLARLRKELADLA